MLQWYKYMHSWWRWDLRIPSPLLLGTVQWNSDLDPVFWNLRKLFEQPLGDLFQIKLVVWHISLSQQAKPVICKIEVDKINNEETAHGSSDPVRWIVKYNWSHASLDSSHHGFTCRMCYVDLGGNLELLSWETRRMLSFIFTTLSQLL